jgi:hypothetical protein
LDDDVEAPQFQSRIKKGEIEENASYFSLSPKNSSVLRKIRSRSRKQERIIIEEKASRPS